MPHDPEREFDLADAGRNVFSKLYKRYQLIIGSIGTVNGVTQVPGGHSVLSTTVQPVDNLTELLNEPLINGYTITGITTTGRQTIVTIPVNERWQLRAVDINTFAGNATIDNLILSDGTTDVRFFTQSAAYSLRTTFPTDLALGPGWEVEFDVDSVSSTSSINIQLLIRRIFV